MSSNQTPLLFVCSNNLNCSPAAAVLSTFYAPKLFPPGSVLSAGPYAGITPRSPDFRMVELMPQETKQNLAELRTTQLLTEHVKYSEQIIVLDEDSAWAVERIMKENGIENKIGRFRELFQDETIFAVPDPSLGESSFKEAFDLIDRGVKNLIVRRMKAE